MNKLSVHFKLGLLLAVLFSFVPAVSNAQAKSGLNYSDVKIVQYCGTMQYGDEYETLTQSGKEYEGAFIFTLDKTARTLDISALDIKNPSKPLMSISSKLSNISPILSNGKLTGIEMMVNGVAYRIFKASDLGLEIRIGKPISMSYLCSPDYAEVSFFYRNETKSSFHWKNDYFEAPDGEYYLYGEANEKFNAWLDYIHTLLR